MEKEYDVICVGGGPGGFPAAVAAARQGAKTLLVERNHFLGGMAATGLGLLGFLDAKGNRVLGGIPQEFVDRLAAMGGTLGHYRCPVHNSITSVNPELVKLAALEMCRDAGVELLLNCAPVSATVTDGRLCKADFFGKGATLKVAAHTFIDATGDGDLAEMAGAEYVYGQGAEHTVQPATLMFTVSGVDLEAVFAYAEAHPSEIVLPDTYASEYTPSFFRQTKGHCFIGFPALLKKAAEDGLYDIPRDRFIYIVSAEEGRLAVNSTRILNVDATDPESVSRAMAEGSRQVLELLNVMHKYLPGFARCRLASVSPMLGVRESRHFRCRRQLTGGDVRAAKRDGQTVALGAYNIDVHHGGDAGITLEPVGRAYGVPLGAMVPTHLYGLLVSGRLIDADPEAFGSCRVMGTCMAIGEAAGVCAAIAAKSGRAAADMPAPEVREALVNSGAIL